MNSSRAECCSVCYSPCSTLNCSCLCTCGPEYSDCLEENLKNFDSRKNGDDSDSSDYSESSGKMFYCSHLNCKKCVDYRCCCLGNQISLNNLRELRSVNNFVANNSLTVNRPDSRTTELRLSNQVISSQMMSNRMMIRRSDRKTTGESSLSQQGTPNVCDYNPLLVKPMSELPPKSSRHLMPRKELDEIYSQVDDHFKELLEYSADKPSKNLYSLRRELHQSLQRLREVKKRNKKLKRWQPVERLNYLLDRQLNGSFRRLQRESGTDSSSATEHYEQLKEEDDPECDLSKFELFKYLSLAQCNEHDRKIEELYPEFDVDATIRNLILFVNLKRFPADHYVKPSLKVCLKNTIDSIQISGDQKPTKSLFTIGLSKLSLFRYLTFLTLNFNEHMCEPVELQLNELICLRHLELYGTKFTFRKAKCHNSSLSNLIVHDKLVNFRVLNLFPNLVLLRIMHVIGDILKSTSKQPRQLRVVSLPDLSFGDLTYLVANCKKLELIECNLIYPQMVEMLKQLPQLKFIFLTLKKEQYKMSRSMAYLIYYNLGTAGKDPFYYSNQLYCPRDHEDKAKNVPCFKIDCPNCSTIASPKQWTSLQNLNEDLIRKKMKKDSRQGNESCLGCMKSRLANVFGRRKNNSMSNLDRSMRGRQSAEKRTNDQSPRKSTSLDGLHSFDRFLTRPVDKTRKSDRSSANKQTASADDRLLTQRIVYLDNFKLNPSNLDRFGRVIEIEYKSANYLRVSELNDLVKLIGLDTMKERLFNAECIEIDESISLSKNELKKLSPLIAYSTGLYVKALDLNTFDYLIKQMPFVKTIEFDNVKIDRMMSSYLANNFADRLKSLQKFSLLSERIVYGNHFRFLLECDSLCELRLINVHFDCDVIAGVLTKNAYCCNVELSKPITEVEQRKIVEVVSFNALVNKNLNYSLKLAKSQYMGIELLTNLRIKA